MTQTPLMKQYTEIKENFRDCILFFRLGDFYEMFFEDAITASKELGLTLTSRNREKGMDVPLAGIPFHSANSYISKMVAKGYKVAICEQVEDPKTAKAGHFTVHQIGQSSPDFKMFCGRFYYQKEALLISRRVADSA